MCDFDTFIGVDTPLLVSPLVFVCCLFFRQLIGLVRSCPLSRLSASGLFPPGPGPCLSPLSSPSLELQMASFEFSLSLHCSKISPCRGQWEGRDNEIR